MLMDINCSAVTSVAVKLTFDDSTVKHRVIGTGDLVSVTYNANGMRKHITGKVAMVSAVGTDPKGWTIIVDGSDDFDADKARFSPVNILDLDIVRKADTLEVVRTPLGHDGIPFLRMHHGRLQYSADGYEWKNVQINERDIIEDQEGTRPYRPGEPTPDDGIEDAVY